MRLRSPKVHHQGARSRSAAHALMKGGQIDSSISGRTHSVVVIAPADPATLLHACIAAPSRGPDSMTMPSVRACRSIGIMIARRCTILLPSCRLTVQPARLQIKRNERTASTGLTQTEISCTEAWAIIGVVQCTAHDIFANVIQCSLL